MQPQVRIEGSGVAAACCAKLLADSGLPFSTSREIRSDAGEVLLSRQTLVLLADIFPAAQLEPICRAINKRIVRWGGNEVTVPHSGFAISQAELLRTLWNEVPEPSEVQLPDWTLACRCAQTSFGSRMATVAPAVVRQSAAQNACWIESVDSGWLFLLPSTLIAVGETIDALLGESQMIAGVIDKIAGPSAHFPAYPRIASPMCAATWLACGSAAIAFDPLCGEGAGHAARQAFLATAVVAAARAGEPVPDLLAHYTSRQTQAFHRHLQICQRFYETAGGTSFWRTEAEQLRAGIEWTQRMLQENARPPAYQLAGKRLLSIQNKQR